MLEALVITLREGIEAALVVGIVLAYLQRTGRPDLKRYVYLGLGAAIVASVAGAILFQAFGIDPENEIMEGTILLVAAAFVGTMIIWMWRTGRRIKRELEAGLERVLADDQQSSSRGAGLGLALFTFAMVLREGIETVLFLTALSASIGGNPLNNLLGGLAGLLLAVLFGFLLVRGSLRINLGRFFTVTSMVLLILVAKLFANGIHEFSEVGLLPTNPTELALIGLLTRESTTIVILVLLIALPALLVLWDAWRVRLPDQLPEESPVERRKRLAQARSARLWATSAAMVALLISSSLLFSVAAASNKGYDPAPVPLSPEGELLKVRLAELEDGHIHKYMHRMADADVRFFLMKRADGSLASAFDACGICPAKGYYQAGDQLMCRNCDAPINLETVGEPGGCNPIPLDVTIDGESALIYLANLTAAKAKFQEK